MILFRFDVIYKGFKALKLLQNPNNNFGRNNFERVSIDDKNNLKVCMQGTNQKRLEKLFAAKRLLFETDLDDYFFFLCFSGKNKWEALYLMTSGGVFGSGFY